MMNRWIASTFAALALFGAPAAQATDPRCVVPEALVYVNATLPHATRALAAKQELRIVILGTSSSTGAGVSQPGNAYPTHLQRVLAQYVAGARIVIVNKAERGAKAETMLSRFEREVIPEKPSLVIWQTGTVEAVQSVDVDAFGEILTRGIDMLQKAKIDVVLMDMQYSPTSTTLLNIGPYKDQMHWVAQETDAALFRRYDIMVRLSRDGTVNLASLDQKEQRRNADLVHLCIGELLGELIAQAMGIDILARPKP